MSSYGCVSGIALHRAQRAVMERMDQVIITPESGIIGDFRGKGGSKRARQVTVLFLDGWQGACAEVRRNISWTERRANVLTLASFEKPPGPWLIGKMMVFSSGVVLEITSELKPCKRMDEVCLGLQEALTKSWRGGVACRVECGGVLALWNTFTLEEEMPMKLV